MLNPKLAPEAASHLQEARARIANQCAIIATMYRPLGFRLVHKTPMQGKVDFAAKTLTSPRPLTRRSLYVFLYLCGLVETDRDTRAAKTWVRETMRRNGVAVPRKGTEMRHGNFFVD